MSVRKDLGMVTAYAYAVSKGYTGTEDQFATLMASYADVGQTAVDAALAAKASEDAAKASETASAASQAAAATSAGTATTAAQTATGAATTATTKAGEAAGSATSAAGSATTAGASATAAQAAQTAAEAAQTAAEDAQAAAEAAAESVSASAAQIAQNTAEISLVKSHLEATYITDTASGAIATFADGSDGVPVESLTVTMEPIQDLHGQANPYPAGGGKNLLEVTATSQTLNGVTFTVNADGTVTANGTATITAFFELIASNISFTESTILNGCPSGGGGDTYAIQLNGTTPLEVGSGVTIAANTTITSVRIRIASGATLNNVVFKPMIRLASVSDSTFAPYSNICPISGRQSLTVTRAGVNVWDEEWELGYYDTRGNPISSSSNIRSKNPIPVLPDTEYYFKTAGVTMYICQYDSNGSYIADAGRQNVLNGTFVTNENARYIKFNLASAYGTTYNHDISINYPATDTDYHPGTVASVEVQLGQTVYGGTVDVVSGEMVVDRAMVDLGTLNWTLTSGLFQTSISNMKKASSNYAADSGAISSVFTEYPQSEISSMNFGFSMPASVADALRVKASDCGTVSDFTSKYGSVQFCYELAQPITITLTGQQLSTGLGVNNVWSDADSVSVDYVADTKLYIQKAISAAVAALS